VHLDGSHPAAPVATLPPATDVRVFPGTVGASSLYYQVEDRELHVLTLDAASQVVDTVVSEPGETSYGCISSIYERAPPGKWIFKDFTSDGLVLVDVSQTTATRVGVLPPSPGASLTCPVWHIDGSAFVYTDLGDTDSRLYRVEWGNSAPSAPELLYESAGEIRAQIFGP
jgi:hypothetical protein